MVYTCYTCQAQVVSISAYCAHLKLVHSNSYSSVFKCCHCTKTYSTLQCLRRHLYQKHPEVAEVVNVAHEVVNNDELPLQPVIPDPEPELEIVPNEVPEISVVDFKLALFDSTLALASKLYSVPSLNRSQVQDILNIASDYVGSGFLDVLKSKTFSILNNLDAPQEDLDKLKEMFASIQDPLIGLRTEKLRLIALEQSKCYIACKPFYIGDCEIVKRVNGQQIRTPIELTGQYICMKKMLTMFLEMPNVFNLIMQNIETLNNSNDFTNIIQGELWQQIKEKFVGRLVFPLVLYFDDAEPDNQCGSHSGSHSLGLVYYYIACLPQYLLSALENIFVSLIFLTSDKKRRNEETFRILVNALKDLETEGIEIRVENNVHRVYFALALLIGDNKGMNGITGFVECFIARHFCRICKDHINVTRYQTVENPNSIRNPLNYEADLTLNDTGITGIKSKCIWNELISYHCTVNISLDMMHDLFEGICHYDLSIVLLHCIEENYFSIETLNERVTYFDFGIDSGNKVSLITVEHLQKQKFKMSASEMYCFCRHLGLIIGDLVPEGDEVWKLYTLLAEIIDIIAAPCVRKNVLPYLSLLISEHHSVYLRVSRSHLVAKFHLLTHTARVLALIGPLFHVWCMRMEAKHRPVVKIPARSHSNRINMPVSTAKRYCLSVAARFLANEGFPSKVKFGQEEIVLSQAVNFDLFSFILPDNYHNFICVDKATICGTEYKQDYCLAFKLSDDLPAFGSILWIVKSPTNEMPFFILSGLRTIGLNEHLHCYEVQPVNEYCYVNYSDLLSFYPTTSRTGADGRSYVTFRHCF